MRSTTWSLLLLAGVSILFTAILTGGSSTEGGSPGHGGDNDIVLDSLAGIWFGQIAAAVLAVLAICPNHMPARLSRMMSLSPPCPGLPPSVLDPPVRIAVSRMDTPTRRSSDQVVLRTVRSFTHSERSACGAPARATTPVSAVEPTIPAALDARPRIRPRRVSGR